MPKIVTQEEFIAQCIEKHHGFYSYEKTIYTGVHDQIIVTCPIHGDFSASANIHKNKGSKCRSCSHENLPGREKYTTAEFIQKSREVHGDHFNYDKVTYVASGTRVTIGCPIHGDFTQKPSAHLRGRGCQDCGESGYRASKAGNFYVLSAGNITKVGITNRTVKTRLNEIVNASDLAFTEVFSIHSPNGRLILDIETACLRFLNSEYTRIPKTFEGASECFYEVDIHNLLNFITPFAATTEPE